MLFFDKPPPAIIIPAPRELLKPARELLLPDKTILPAISFISSGRFGAAAPPSNDFRTTGNLSTNVTSYDFGSLDIGTADATRIVVVGVRARSAAQPSSVTIGGNAATSQASANTLNIVHVSFWTLAVSSGTTANVTVNFAAAANNCSVGVWRLINAANSTPHATASDNTFTTNALASSLNIPSNGSLFCIAGHNDGASARTCTWNNATERFDATSEGTDTYTGASETGLSTETPRTITATYSGGSGPIGVLLLMSWN